MKKILAIALCLIMPLSYAVESEHAKDLIVDLAGSAKEDSDLMEAAQHSVKNLYSYLSKEDREKRTLKTAIKSLGLTEEELKSASSEFSGELKQQFEDIKGASAGGKQDKAWKLLQDIFKKGSGSKVLENINAELSESSDEQISITRNR